MFLFNFIQNTGSTLFCQIVLERLLLDIDSAWYGVTIPWNSRSRDRMLVSVYHAVKMAILRSRDIKCCAAHSPSTGVSAVLQGFSSSQNGPFLVGPIWTPAHSMAQVFILMLHSVIYIRYYRLCNIHCFCFSRTNLVTVARNSRCR